MSETNQKTTRQYREDIIDAGRIAVMELIKVAKQGIINVKDSNDVTPELAADRLKNAAATKKLAIFDAFDILTRIDEEQNILNSITSGVPYDKSKGGFAEQRSK